MADVWPLDLNLLCGVLTGRCGCCNVIIYFEKCLYIIEMQAAEIDEEGDKLCCVLVSHVLGH